MEEAMRKIERDAGTEIDPSVVERFIPLFNDVSVMLTRNVRGLNINAMKVSVVDSNWGGKSKVERASHNQYVEFSVGDENYAILISEIHEIIRMLDITEIPNCPSYVQGVINLRGKIVPVISLRSLFALEGDTLSKSTRIVVVNHSEESVGIIVDRVNKVTTFTDIQTPPERIGGVSGSYFVGIGISSDELVGILKLDEVLLRE